MSKKVIEPVIIKQKNTNSKSIQIESDDKTVTLKASMPYYLHCITIDKSKATTVAKAICPEYQKVIDQIEPLEYEIHGNKTVMRLQAEEIFRLKDENKTLTTQNGAYKTLKESQEQTIIHYSNKAKDITNAIATLESEREMNAILTNEIESLKDQNAKLVEALEEAKDINFDILCLLKRAIYFIDMTDEGYSSNLKQEIIKTLQNTKKIEG